MNILFTNDDGIKAAGLLSLVKKIPPSVRACVVAPVNEKSACSHSISLGQKLRVEESVVDGLFHYAVHGTPADCVKFAISELKQARNFVPDLVISGVNQGANTGVSVYYSGTISAAREALINRIPSVAISLCSKTSQDFLPSVNIVHTLIEGYAAKQFSTRVLLNVNVPALPADQIKGAKITKQAASRFIEEFVPGREHDGKKVYTLAGEIELMDPDGTSDEEAVMEGYVSITPLKLDVTDYEVFPAFEKWLKAKGGGL